MDAMKLKAATLIEALVAMVVVMICFGIATMIYTNVMNSDNQRLKLKAHLLINEAAVKAKNEKLFLDEEIKDEVITVRKTVTPYKEANDVIMLELTASANGKTIETYKELICIACAGN